MGGQQKGLISILGLSSPSSNTNRRFLTAVDDVLEQRRHSRVEKLIRQARFRSRRTRS